MLFQLDFTTTSQLNETEVTDLVDIDRRVAEYFMDAIHMFSVTDTERKENKEFVNFMNLDAKLKVFYGQYDDPKQFIDKLASKKLRERDNLLPAVYIGRQPTITFADGSDYVDEHCQDIHRSSDDSILGQVYKSYLKITYDVSLLAWNQAVSDRLALGLAMWLRNPKAKKRTFTAQTKVANTALESQISLEGKKDVMFEPLMFEAEKRRVTGHRMSIDVVAEVFEVVAVEQSTSTISVAEGTVINHG